MVRVAPGCPPRAPAAHVDRARERSAGCVVRGAWYVVSRFDLLALAVDGLAPIKKWAAVRGCVECERR